MIDLAISSVPGGRLTLFGVLLVLYWTRGYWLGPILFISKPAIPPTTVDLADERSIPNTVRRHLADHAAVLAKLGFVATPAIREHNGTGNVMYHQFHRHQRSGDVAAVGVFVAGMDPRPRSRTLAFSAHLGDRTDVVTMTDTLGLRGAPPEPAGRIVLWMGDAIKYGATPDDAVRVYRIHRALVRRSRTTQKPLPVDDPVAFQKKLGGDWRQRMIDSGWYQDDGKGGIRPTVRGACLSIWVQLWPWRGMRRGLERQRVTQLMGEWARNPEPGSLAA